MGGHTGARDFDFLHGSWHVSHRKLKKRLAGCTAWYSYEGTLEARPVLGEVGIFDDGFFDDPNGAYRGAAIRRFDPKTGDWSIYWFDERFVERGVEPLIGRFTDGIGTFLADETWEGTPITVRFQWWKITPTSCQWDQAFSTDGSQTWETNWVQTLSRTG